MTEKETIEFMQRYTDADCYTNKCVSAHKIAIKALERQELLKRLLTCHDDFSLDTTQKNYELVKAVRNILGMDKKG